MYAISEKDKDFDNLIKASEKIKKEGDKIFLLPNPQGVKSGDLVLVRNDSYNLYDVKTINSNNNVEQRLEQSKGQANRIIVQINSKKYSSRLLAKQIKNYYNHNNKAVEVIILRKGKKIYIDRQQAESKNFYENFIFRFEK